MKIMRSHLRRIISEELSRALEEAAPGAQIFEPGTTDKGKESWSVAEPIAPHPMMADALSGLSDEDKARAFFLEWARLASKDSPHNVISPKNMNMNLLGSMPYAGTLVNYLRNLGLQTGAKGAQQSLHTNLLKLTADLADRVFNNPDLTGGFNWGESHDAMLVACESESGIGGYRGKVHRDPEWCQLVETTAITMTDPVSGDTFRFMPSSHGMGSSVKVVITSGA